MLFGADVAEVQIAGELDRARLIVRGAAAQLQAPAAETPGGAGRSVAAGAAGDRGERTSAPSVWPCPPGARSARPSARCSRTRPIGPRWPSGAPSCTRRSIGSRSSSSGPDPQEPSRGRRRRPGRPYEVAGLGAAGRRRLVRRVRVAGRAARHRRRATSPGAASRAASAMGQLRTLTRAFALAETGAARPGEALTLLNRHQLALGRRAAVHDHLRDRRSRAGDDLMGQRRPSAPAATRARRDVPLRRGRQRADGHRGQRLPDVRASGSARAGPWSSTPTG